MFGWAHTINFRRLRARHCVQAKAFAHCLSCFGQCGLASHACSERPDQLTSPCVYCCCFRSHVNSSDAPTIRAKNLKQTVLQKRTVSCKNAQCFVVAHLEARPKAVAICCVSCPEYRSRQLMLRKRMDHKHTALLFETQNNTWHLHQSEPRPMPHNHDHAHKAEADGTKRPWRLPKICDFLEAMSMI